LDCFRCAGDHLLPICGLRAHGFLVHTAVVYNQVYLAVCGPKRPGIVRQATLVVVLFDELRMLETAVAGLKTIDANAATLRFFIWDIK
jgi:hypothetical protein